MAKISDILPWKLAIEQDAKLSHSAARVGWRVGSYVYTHPQHRFLPDEPFPLGWRVVSKLCFNISEREVYRCLRELIECGYMKHCGVKGVPGTANYRLLLTHQMPCHSSAKSGRTRSAKNGRTASANCDRTSSAQNVETSSAMKRSPLTNSSLREEMVGSNGRNSSGGKPPTGDEEGKQQPPSADSVGVPLGERLEKFRTARKQSKI